MGDNLYWAVLDGCCGVVYWDDNQVTEGHYYVIECNPEEKQRTEVKFWRK